MRTGPGIFATCIFALGLLGSQIHCDSSKNDSATGVPPTITSQPSPQTVIAGATANFTVVATGSPLSYRWNLNGAPIAGVAATNATYSIATTPAMIGGQFSYTVTVTAGTSSVTSVPALLTVTSGAPTITTQPQAGVIAVGSALNLNVEASGTAPLTYLWYHNGAAIPEATSATYAVPSAQLSDGGSYYVVVSNGTLPNATSNTVNVTVFQAPVITGQPLPQTVIAGATANFTVVATGSPLSYRWNLNGAPIAGVAATNATYSIATTPAMIGGKFSYTVTVTAGTSSVTSDPALLTVTSGPVAPTIITQPQGGNVGFGTPLQLNVVATGTSPLTYLWYHGGTAIATATSATYTVPSAQQSDGGPYYVIVSNGAGSVESATATVTIIPTYAVSGSVSLFNGGLGSTLPPMVMTIGTNPVQTVNTDKLGNFSFLNIVPGTYTITAALLPTEGAPSSAFLPVSQSVTVPEDNVAGINFQVALGYTVSGSVNYNGPEEGPIYLTLTPQGGGSPLGTSIPTQGAFTVRGVPPGVYTLAGYMDLVGDGRLNQNDPYWQATNTVTVSDANLTGLAVPLADPNVILAGTDGPTNLVVNPIKSGAIITYKPLRTPTGVPLARTYTLEWTTDPAFGSGVNSLTFPDNQGNVCFISSGLVNGFPGYYFRLRGNAGPAIGVQSTNTTTSALVTIGPGTGLNTISGQVAFTGPATGPLVVGLYDQGTGQVYATTIASPVSPQTYSVSGVPDGTYFLFGVIDQNDNGVIDAGDITNTRDNSAASITVSGDLIGANLTLPSAPATVTLTTQHALTASSESYSLNFTARDGMEHITQATLLSGPNVVVPTDIGVNQQSGQWNFVTGLATVRPGLTDSYGIQLTFSDGTVTILQAPVTGVLDAFAQDLAPTGSGSGDVTPDFSWQAPLANATPASYTYQFAITPATGGNSIWQVPGSNSNVNGLASSILFLNWNADPNDANNLASGPLVIGDEYFWTITVQDDNGNQAQTGANYQP